MKALMSDGLRYIGLISSAPEYKRTNAGLNYCDIPAQEE